MQLHVEFTVFEWLTLYSWPLRCTVESSSSQRPVPGRIWRTCKVSALYLENCANARWINVFWVINPLFLTPLGTVESSTPPRPVPGSRWRSCEVSTLYLENCAIARRIYVFWVINPLFLTPPGYGRIINLSMTRPCEFQLCISITVRMCVEFTFLWLTFYSFLWLTLYSWSLRGYDRIVNLCATFSEESLTYLLSFNSVSWKLCECTSNFCFWVVNPLFLTPLGVRSNRQRLHDLFRGVDDVPLKFQLCILKTANARRIYVFWVVNPLFLTPPRVG